MAAAIASSLLPPPLPLLPLAFSTLIATVIDGGKGLIEFDELFMDLPQNASIPTPMKYAWEDSKGKLKG